MRFALLTFLCYAAVTAFPREDSLAEWGETEGKHPYEGTVNVIKKVDGGVGGGAGVIGIGGGSCDPAACDAKVRCVSIRRGCMNTNIRFSDSLKCQKIGQSGSCDNGSGSPGLLGLILGQTRRFVSLSIVLVIAEPSES